MNIVRNVWKSWFKHNKCWANPASSKNVNLRILVASSFSGECEKCRKGARERERSMRYSLCFHNRTASSTWRPLHVSESSLLFLSTVSLDFFSFAHRWTFLVPFFLACLHSFFQKVEVSKIDRANSKSLITRFLFDRVHFTQKKRAPCRSYKWLM